jgi:Icc-related predicted phosphoesterase
MKFLVVTDIHGKKSAADWINSRAKANGADCVIMLGDITDFGPEEVASELIDLIDLDVYAIPGNCDPLTLPSVIAAHGTDMHGRSVSIGGIHMAGLGGSNPTIFDTPFELSEDDIFAKLNPISKKGMVLMVHVPPYGINDMIPSGLNVGSRSVLKIVKKYKPLLVLSGHIHEAVGIVVKDGTTFINPGPAKDGRCAVVSVDNGKVEAKLFGPMD